MDCLVVDVAEGGSKCHPFGRNAAHEVLVFPPEFSCSSVLVQHGNGIDRPTIRLGLALLLREAQGRSFIAEMKTCLGFRILCDLRWGIRKLDSGLLYR